MNDQEAKRGILIPRNKLASDVLEALIEEFILREGTDYGQNEVTLEQKKKQIFNQLNAEHIVILFDPDRESTTLMTRERLTKLHQQNFEILG